MEVYCNSKLFFNNASLNSKSIDTGNVTDKNNIDKNNIDKNNINKTNVDKNINKTNIDTKNVIDVKNNDVKNIDKTNNTKNNDVKNVNNTNINKTNNDTKNNKNEIDTSLEIYKDSWDLYFTNNKMFQVYHKDYNLSIIKKYLPQKYTTFSGSHSVIFYPGLYCDPVRSDKSIDNICEYINYHYTSNNYISKVLSKNKAKHELDINNKLRKVDPNGKHIVTYEMNKGARPIIPFKYVHRYSINVDSCEVLYAPYSGCNLEYYTEVCNENIREFDIFDYFIQAIQGLSIIHSAGVAHLDVKPSNLVILDGNLKYIDFGISEYKYSPDSFGKVYCYWSPDFIALDMKENIEMKKTTLQETLTNIIVTYQKELYALDRDLEELKLVSHIAKLMMENNCVSYYQTVDIFGLGITFNYIFKSFDINIEFINEIISLMLMFDPYKRITSEGLLLKIPELKKIRDSFKNNF